MQKIEPPCATCRPPLLIDNVPAVQLYGYCSDQWRRGEDGRRMTIANSDIIAALDTMGIDDAERESVFAAVKQIIAEITALLSLSLSLSGDTM